MDTPEFYDVPLKCKWNKNIGAFIKADIFSMSVAFNPNEISVADTSDEALIASLNKYGEIRLEYM